MNMMHLSDRRAHLEAAQRHINSLDASLLLAHALSTTREHLIAHPDVTVPWIKSRRFWRLVHHRAQGTPLSYLLGKKEFFNLDFFVNKHTLIPRPETELVVSLALDTAAATGKNVTLVDVGTGSSCIPIAFLKNFNGKPSAVFATDISRGALRMAKKNAMHHGVAITFLHGNLLEPLFEKIKKTSLASLIITANLPYLTPAEYQNEPTIQKEPRSALVGGSDGLDDYRALWTQIKNLHILHPSSITVLCEINPDQKKALQEIVYTHFPNAAVTAHRDLASRERVVCVRIPAI